MADYDFREIERTPQDDAALQKFESYRAGLKMQKIGVGIGAITGALAGSKGGIPGIAVGAVLGTLSGFWRYKAYREQAYALMKSAGLIRKRQLYRRDVWSIRLQTFAFLRLPYAELTAWRIVPILQAHYPDMTDRQLQQIGADSQRALIKFRRENPDIPIELAADAILAWHGILRDAAGNYDLVTVEPRYRPPDVAHIPTMPTEPDGGDGAKPPTDYTTYLKYGLLALAIVLMLRE